MQGSNYVAGDTHGEQTCSNLSVKYWPEQKQLTKDDVLIILGDFGYIWESKFCKTERWWKNWLCEKRFTIAFIDGNHENFTLLKMFPLVKKWGGYVRVIDMGNCVVYWLLRGEVYTINGQTILTMGGADSHDVKPNKEIDELNLLHSGIRIKNTGRKPLVDWWPDEQITQYDVDNAINNLKRYNNKVDYVLSHSLPLNDAIFLSIKTKLGDSILGDIHTSMEHLETIKNIVQYKEWHCGHFHCDIWFDKFRIHFNNEPYRLP